MAIKINSGYSVQAPVVIDDRQYLTKTQMKSVNDNIMPSKYFAICADDGLLYCYDKTNTSVDDSGKFRPADAQRKVLLSPWAEYPDTAIQNLSSSLKYGYFYRNVLIKTADVDFYTPKDNTKSITLGGETVSLADLEFIGNDTDDDSTVIAVKAGSMSVKDAKWDVTDVMNGAINDITATDAKAIAKFTIKEVDGTDFTLDLEDTNGDLVVIDGSASAGMRQLPNYGYWKNFKVQDGIDGSTNRVFQYAVMPKVEDFVDEFETEEEALTWAVQYVGVSGAFQNAYWYQPSGSAPVRYALYMEESNVVDPSWTYIGVQVDQLGNPVKDGNYIAWKWTDEKGVSCFVKPMYVSVVDFEKFLAKTGATITTGTYSGTPDFSETTTTITIGGTDATIAKAGASGSAYPKLVTGSATEDGWVCIDVQDDANDGDVHRYTTLPTAGILYFGDIAQYIGETNANYTRGFFYECKRHITDDKESVTYAWEEVCTERDMVGRYVVMPYPSETFEDDIVQYIGEGKAPYERGLFYECVNVNERQFFCVSGLEDNKFSIIDPQANKAYTWSGTGNFTPSSYEFKSSTFSSDWTDCAATSYTKFDSIASIESGWDTTKGAPYFVIHALKDSDEDPDTDPEEVNVTCFLYNIKETSAYNPTSATDVEYASEAWVTSLEAQWNVTLGTAIYRWKPVKVSECEKLQFKKFEDPSLYEGRVLQYIGADDTDHNLKYGRFYTGINETIDCRVYAPIDSDGTTGVGYLVPKNIVANGNFYSYHNTAANIPTTDVIEPDDYNTGWVFVGYCEDPALHSGEIVYCDAPADFSTPHFIATKTSAEATTVVAAKSYNVASAIKEASISTGWYWKQVHTEDVDSISYSSDDTRIFLDNLQGLKKSDLANMSFADYMAILQRVNANTEIEFDDTVHEGMYHIFESATAGATCVVKCTKAIAPNPASTKVKYVWQKSSTGAEGSFTNIGTESSTVPTTLTIDLIDTLNANKLPGNPIYVRILTTDGNKTGADATQASNVLKIQSVLPVWVGDAAVTALDGCVGGVATFVTYDETDKTYNTLVPTAMLAALEASGNIIPMEQPTHGSGASYYKNFTPENECTYIAMPSTMYGWPDGVSKITDGNGLDFTDSFVKQAKIEDDAELDRFTIGVKFFEDVDFVMDYVIFRTEYPATLDTGDSYEYTFEF